MSPDMIEIMSKTDTFKSMLESDLHVTGWSMAKNVMCRDVIRQVRLTGRKQQALAGQLAMRFPISIKIL